MTPRTGTRLVVRTLTALTAAALAVVGTAAVPAAAVGVTSGSVAQYRVEDDAAVFEDRILQLLNADRRDKGLRPLARTVELDAVARSWSAQMAREDSMYHNPRYTQQLPSGWTRAGENVAMGYTTPENMYQGWYNSPGHYKNMFNPEFTHIGIGVAYARGNGMVIPYGTQNFGTYTGRSLTQTPAAAAAQRVAPQPGPVPGDDGASTRRIDDGGIGGAGREFHLANGFTGRADHVFGYGNAGGRFYVGDWDGDGTDTLAYRIGNVFYFRSTNSSGGATQVVSYGRPGDRVYVGDWDGDGTDTLAVRRGKVYHVKNSISGGAADRVIAYGREGDDVLVGDWNGDGTDTLAVRRGRTYHVKNSMAGGPADQVVHYGRPGDDVYVGDWDGDGRDSFTVRRDRTYFIANAIRGGNADRALVYGRSRDTTLVGDWDGDGVDTLGIRR
ncbi:MAG TPA: CAP domain-containing protein [Phototrophicaceae bacterium]|nr:CAP domain-containing protein [Phototrophicaceae bacterium]